MCVPCFIEAFLPSISETAFAVSTAVGVCFLPNKQGMAHAYAARIKAKTHNDTIFGPSRTRNDRVDIDGKVSLRRAGK
jgi:hypothetical protein